MKLIFALMNCIATVFYCHDIINRKAQMDSYKLQIAEVKRNLPLCKIKDDLYIAAFVIIGDVELTHVCAAELLKIAPPFDVLMTAEAKGIPLVHEMARLSGMNRYIVARKLPKLYMRNVVSVEVNSITTAKKQELHLDSDDVEYMSGKRILLVDDVISTGESIGALEKLCAKVGANIVGKMAVLAEGEAAARGDILYLQPLPLFNGKGEAI